MEVGVQCHAPAALNPVKGPSAHCTGGCVGLGASPRQLQNPPPHSAIVNCKPMDSHHITIMFVLRWSLQVFHVHDYGTVTQKLTV